MTRQEFNEKYKDYIECREYIGKNGETKRQCFDGLEFDIPEITIFLDNIFQDLTQIPGFTYSQIKIKFDMARFYTNLKSINLMWAIEHEINKMLKNENNTNI